MNVYVLEGKMAWDRSRVRVRSSEKIRKEFTGESSTYNTLFLENLLEGFPRGAVVESLPASAGYTGSSPGLGRSHMPRSN